MIEFIALFVVTYCKVVLLGGCTFGVLWLINQILAWLCSRDKPEYHYVTRAPNLVPIATALIARHKDGSERVVCITGAGKQLLREYGASMAWICGDDNAPSGDVESHLEWVRKWMKEG